MSFNQTPRPHQKLCLDDALAFIAKALEATPCASETTAQYRRRRSICYAAPTGSGKGSIELMLSALLRHLKVIIVTPSLEIGRSFVERSGGDPNVSAPKLAEAMAALGVYTPIRLRNIILREGVAGIGGMPDVVIVDESHHSIAANESGGTLFALMPLAVWVGFTATPFRATPKETQALHEEWGEPVAICDLPQAVDLGLCSMPTVTIRPLVDDDQVRLSKSGEFEIQHLGDATRGRIDDLVALLAEYVTPASLDGPGVEVLTYDRPTLLVLPTVDLCTEVSHRGMLGGAPIGVVTGDTPHRERAAIYANCRAGLLAIATVAVIAEGVDLPWLRRMVDAKPCNSPVRYLQQVGRIMRPVEEGEEPPELIVTNRNMERNGYLFEGVLPRSVIADSQTAFGGPSARGAARHLGLTAMRRFRVIHLPLADGSTAMCFNLYRSVGTGTEEIFVLSIPGQAEPLVAKRVNTKDGFGRKTWGKWEPGEIPDEGLTGFATSQQRSELSPKQRGWWEKSARRHGLDPGAAGSLSRRQFSALPVLSDLKLRVNVEAGR